MRRRDRGQPRYAALAAVALVALLGGVCPAQEAPPETNADLQRRVRVLEDALRRVEAELARRPAPGKADEPPSTPEPTDRKRIEGVVNDVLKTQEERKKEQERQRSKEAESKFVPVGSDLSLKGSWKDGPVWESPNKDFRLHVGGRFDADWAWFGAGRRLQTGPGGVGELEDGAEFRRARVRFDGAAYEVIEWLAEFDFATAFDGQANHPAITDLYLDVTQMPVVGNFRAGHFREPFGLEALTSGNALTFLERSNSWEALVPFRNMGMMLYNTALDDRATWAAGLFRANSRNGGNPFDYGDGEYAVTGRVTALPWYEQEGRCLLHLGADFSHRSGNRDAGQEPFRYRSFPGIRVGRYVFADTGNIPAESADLANAEFGLNLGSFSVQAEYCRVWVHDARLGGGVRSPRFSSWYVQASYFLTGEYRTYRRYVGQRTVGVFDRPRPSEDFFFVPLGEGGGWRDWGLGRGAWEVAVRYSSLDLDDPSQGVPAQTLRDVTLGLNWYLTFNTKVQWNYILADRDFESRGNRGVAHIFAMRFHHDF